MISKYLEYQQEVKMMLDNSYKNNRLSHAYIFYGDKGVGKEEMALYLTALLNSDGVVDFTSSATKNIFEHDFINLYEISPKKNEIVKEDVLGLLKEFSKTSLKQGDRVFIIHDADKLNTKTSNMLLKFIEEAPLGVHGILLTTNISNILPTIISRCNIVKFKPLNKQILFEELKYAGVLDNKASIIVEFTNDKEEGIKLDKEVEFNKALEIVLALIQAKNEIDGLKLLRENMASLDNQDILRYSLDMLTIFFEEMMREEITKIIEYKDIIQTYKKNNKNDKIKERLLQVLSHIKMLDSNVVAKNIWFSLLINMYR